MNRNTPDASLFILIHGAWHGAWCWNELVGHLEGKGHSVIAPDLPGHGQDATAVDEIDLASYVNFIQDLICAQDAKVILVGHSMAGVIISQLAENIPEKISKLVYLAAFIPKNNGSLLDEAGQASTPGVSVATRVEFEKNLILLEKSKVVKNLFFNACKSEIADKALSCLQSNEPFKPFIDTIHITEDRFGKVDKVYIECCNDNAITITDQRRMYKDIVSNVMSMNADHSPFISNVDELGVILTKCLD